MIQSILLGLTFLLVFSLHQFEFDYWLLRLGMHSQKDPGGDFHISQAILLYFLEITFQIVCRVDLAAVDAILGSGDAEDCCQ